MELYLTDINRVDSAKITEISEERRQKAQRLKLKEDRLRCIAAGLLEKRFLHECEIEYNQHGKPEVSGGGKCFNLSHSGDYVLLVLSDSDIGCDLQRVEYVRAQRLAELVFCENERALLSGSADKLTAFYKLWTKKESFLKCTGEGFHRNAQSVDVSSDSVTDKGERYHLKTYSFSDYTISVCAKTDAFPKHIEFVDFD